MTDERLARAALCRLTEPADPRVTRALAQVGAVRLYEDVLANRSTDDLVADAAGRLTRLDPARELEQAATRGIRFLVPGDTEWPTQLDDLDHAPSVSDLGGRPIGLWVRGPQRLDEVGGSVAVVGSRSATAYGESVARELGAGVARAGRCLVSGAAFGIDQAAHRGALALDGASVAVLACGADRPYPVEHRALIDHLAATGAVVSELPPGCAPLPVRFLARNRIIAALTCGTVVVEAAIRSGALNTAAWATSLSRPLMGVPGPVTSAPSQGVHQWIRSGAASLVTGPADLLEMVGGAGEHLVDVPRAPERPRDRLTRRHRQVLEAVPVRHPAGLESIAATAGIALLHTQTALTYLAERDFVVRDAAGWRLGRRGRSDLPGSAR
ncbi:DNA-processing protein DprA [Nocardioides coralli]|uniref:DNA-processing protein DprA n=1 Tax=Nocardioides coralli TaxID=2872154 RepID=UPI001CA46DB3|nr:DNA-processing protein DprA [Nocardioides coralli]QZY28118.1 DNA-processing protein DprA [Nocardioides coralli]